MWPLVVLGVLTLTGRLWAILAVSVAGALASAAAMALLYRHGTGLTRLYYGTDTHGQCMLVGAALASGLALFARHRHTAAAPSEGRPLPGGDPAWAASSRWARTLLSILGAAGVVGAGLLWSQGSYNGSFLWEGGFMVAALSTAAVLLCVVCAQGSWLAVTLSVSPLRYLGRISYGLYLWHYPLFQWIDGQRTGLTGYALFGVRFVATVAVATVVLPGGAAHPAGHLLPAMAGVGGRPGGGGRGEHHGGARHRVRDGGRRVGSARRAGGTGELAHHRAGGGDTYGAHPVRRPLL